MDEWLINGADYFGTAVFALTGAIKGIANKLDLLGVLVLGCTVGIGGGLIRDAVCGMTPAGALTNVTYLHICILTAAVVFFLPRKWFQYNHEIIVLADAVGLGVFTSIGNVKAAQIGMPPITIVLSGVITATGGGVIRDVLVCSVPQVLKHDFYATASLLGGILFCGLSSIGYSGIVLYMTVSFAVFLLRIVAYYQKLQLPK